MAVTAGPASVTEGAQTPRQLLEQLRRISDEVLPDAGFLESVAESTADRFGYTDEQREALRGMAATQDARFMRRMPGLLVRFSPQAHARLLDEDNCLIGLIWTRDVNAHALRAGNGGWLIVLNEGLVAFVYKLLRSLMLRIKVTDPAHGSPPGGPTVYAANMIAIVLDWYRATGFAAGPDFPVTQQQVEMASRLAAAAENFVIAHELAHQMLDHPAHAPRSLLVNGREVQAAKTSFDDEHEADTWGVRFVIDSLEGQGGMEFAVAYAGIEAFFAAVTLLEEHVGAPPSDTHPPAADRLAEVRDFTRQIITPDSLHNLTRFADELNGWIDDVRQALATLVHPSVVPGRWREPEEAREQFENLLDGVMSDSPGLPRGMLASSVMHRMWDVPADTYCALMADRLGRAYEQRDTTALVELAVMLLPTGPLQRAVDERLEIPFLQELTERVAEQRRP